jgi:hypothetical protein
MKVRSIGLLQICNICCVHRKAKEVRYHNAERRQQWKSWAVVLSIGSIVTSISEQIIATIVSVT